MKKITRKCDHSSKRDKLYHCGKRVHKKKYNKAKKQIFRPVGLRCSNKVVSLMPKTFH